MARTAAWLMVAAWGLAAMRLLASSGETGVGDSSGDEFHVVERKSLEYRHELRVTAMTEKSEKIVNPLRWLPLEYFVPDGAEVRKGDLIARFNQTSSRHDEKSQSMELAVVEAELQRRLTAIDNRNLEMDESLGDLQDKLASLEAKLTRLLSEPNQDDIRIAEGKLSLDAIRRIINHPALRELPFILETPQEQDAGYAVEIAMLREMRED